MIVFQVYYMFFSNTLDVLRCQLIIAYFLYFLLWTGKLFLFLNLFYNVNIWSFCYIFKKKTRNKCNKFTYKHIKEWEEIKPRGISSLEHYLFSSIHTLLLMEFDRRRWRQKYT